MRAIFSRAVTSKGCLCANKVEGERACLIHENFSAHQGVEDDDANVLCLGARVVGSRLALEIVQAWVQARFSKAERHQRRVGKILAIERKYLRGG